MNEQILNDEIVQFELLATHDQAKQSALERIDPIVLNIEKLSQWFTQKDDKKWLKILTDGLNPIDHKVDWCHLDKVDKQKHKKLLFRSNYLHQDETPFLLDQYLQAGFIEKCTKNDLHSSSPIFTVVTPNKWRLVYDVRGLNKFFQPQSTTLPAPTAPIIRKGDKYFAKIDLSNAFMHIPLHVAMQKWFGFEWKGQYYRFIRMPFGWNMAPWICQKIMERVVRQIKTVCLLRGVDVIMNIYYDDLEISGGSKPDCEAAYNIARELLKSAGFAVNDKKCIPPSHSIDWIGFKIEQGSITLTQKMKDKINDLYKHFKKHFYSRQNTVPVDNQIYTVGNYLSFLGVMNFCARIVHGARPRLSKLMSTLPAELRVDVTHHDDALRVNEQEFINIKEVVNMMKAHQCLKIEIHDETLEVMTDASIHQDNGPILGFSNGFGNERQYILREEQKDAFAYKFVSSRDIALFEALAVYLAIKNCPYYRKNIIVWCDSQVVEYAFKNIASSNSKLTEIIENTKAAAAAKNLVVVIRPVRSKLNNADKPSRDQIQFNAKWNDLFVENYMFPITLKEHLDTLDNQNHIVQGKLATALNAILKKDNAAYGLRKYHGVVLSHIDEIHGTNAHMLVNAIAQALWIDKSLWDIQNIRQIIDILRSNGYTKKRILEKIAMTGRKPDWMIHGASDPEEEYERRDINLTRRKKKGSNHKPPSKVFFEDSQTSDSSDSSDEDHDFQNRDVEDQKIYIDKMQKKLNPVHFNHILGVSLKIDQPIQILPDDKKPEVIKPFNYLEFLQAQPRVIDIEDSQDESQNILKNIEIILEEEQQESQYSSEREQPVFYNPLKSPREEEMAYNENGSDDDDSEDDPQQEMNDQRQFIIPDSIISQEQEDESDRYQQHRAYAQFDDEIAVQSLQRIGNLSNDLEEQDYRIGSNLRMKEGEDLEQQIEIDDEDQYPDQDNELAGLLKAKSNDQNNLRLDGMETNYSMNVPSHDSDNPEPDNQSGIQQNKFQGPSSGPGEQIDSSKQQLFSSSSLIDRENEMEIKYNEIKYQLQEYIDEYDILAKNNQELETLCKRTCESLQIQQLENQEFKDRSRVLSQQLNDARDQITFLRDSESQIIIELKNDCDRLNREVQQQTYLTNTSEDNISRLIGDIESLQTNLDQKIKEIDQLNFNINFQDQQASESSIKNEEYKSKVKKIITLADEEKNNLTMELNQHKQINISLEMQLKDKKLQEDQRKPQAQKYDINHTEDIKIFLKENPQVKLEDVIANNLAQFKIKLSRNEDPKTLEGYVWITDYLSQISYQQENYKFLDSNPLAIWAATRVANFDQMVGENNFGWYELAGLSQFRDLEDQSEFVQRTLLSSQTFINLQNTMPSLAQNVSIQANTFANILRAILLDTECQIPPLSLIMLIVRTPRQIISGQCITLSFAFWLEYLNGIVRNFTGMPVSQRIDHQDSYIQSLQPVFTYEQVFDAIPKQRRNSEEFATVDVEISQYKKKHIRVKSEDINMNWNQNIFSHNAGRIASKEIKFNKDQTPVFNQNWNLGGKGNLGSGDIFKEPDPQTDYEVLPFDVNNSYAEEQKQGQEEDPANLSMDGKLYQNIQVKTYNFDLSSPLQTKDLTDR